MYKCSLNEVSMTNQIQEIQSLLQLRADLTSRLNLMSYDGTPEIKEIGRAHVWTPVTA